MYSFNINPVYYSTENNKETPVEKIIRQYKLANSEKKEDIPTNKTLSTSMRAILWIAVVIAIITLVVVVYKKF